MSYQSPICLTTNDVVHFHQYFEIHGRNIDAIYNVETKNYEVTSKVILNLNRKKYVLDEYHFHTPGEHIINTDKYQGEAHFVFIQCKDKEFQPIRFHSNICGCHQPHDADIVVIGRMIQNSNETKDLANLQVKPPHYYFEYDGTLTTANYSPVRWIVGEIPINLNISQLSSITKPSREIQVSDGRIILYSQRE